MMAWHPAQDGTDGTASSPYAGAALRRLTAEEAAYHLEMQFQQQQHQQQPESDRAQDELQERHRQGNEYNEPNLPRPRSKHPQHVPFSDAAPRATKAPKSFDDRQPSYHQHHYQHQQPSHHHHQQQHHQHQHHLPRHGAGPQGGDGAVSDHLRDKGIVCQRYVFHGRCPVANCPYAHIQPGSEQRVPHTRCDFFVRNRCLRETCNFFHGPEEDFMRLRAIGRTYFPLDWMPMRDPLRELEQGERDFRAADLPPGLITGCPAGARPTPSTPCSTATQQQQTVAAMGMPMAMRPPSMRPRGGRHSQYIPPPQHNFDHPGNAPVPAHTPVSQPQPLPPQYQQQQGGEWVAVDHHHHHHHHQQPSTAHRPSPAAEPVKLTPLPPAPLDAL